MSSEVIESKPMSFADFGKLVEKSDARKAVNVFVSPESSDVVIIRRDANIEHRTIKGDKGTYKKFAVPVIHDDQPKYIELFFNEVSELLAKADSNPGDRVTISKNKEGKHTFS